MPENPVESKDGHLRKALKRSRGWLKARLQTPESKDREKAHLLESYIQKGLEAIKQEDYQQATSYFEDEYQAKKMGLGGITIFSIPVFKESQDQLTESFLSTLITHIAMRTKLTFGGQYGLMPNPEDDFKLAKSQGIIPDFQLARPQLFIGDQEIPFPASIYQNMTLVYAEEWLHGLQVLREGPIAGVEDPEVDVAAYLLNNGVPLTPQFMARYNRAELPKSNS